MLTMDKKEIAKMLLKAHEEAKPIPLEYRQDFTIEEAYAVQTEVMKEKIARGGRVIGKKIGFTGRGMRKQFGIDTPDYGNIFDDEIYAQGTAIEAGKFISPRVEGEIAFLLKKDLSGPNCTVYDVIQATDGIMACLEFVDSRWGSNFTFIDSVADNGGCGGFLLGSKFRKLEEIDLRTIGMYMTKNGELVHSGAGVEVMGDPINAVVWLANQLAEHGSSMKAGDIVLSGAVTASVPVEAGDCMNICFAELGNIEVKFI